MKELQKKYKKGTHPLVACRLPKSEEPGEWADLISSFPRFPSDHSQLLSTLLRSSQGLIRLFEAYHF
jgi:hypothetical protein